MTPLTDEERAEIRAALAARKAFLRSLEQTDNARTRERARTSLAVVTKLLEELP